MIDRYLSYLVIRGWKHLGIQKHTFIINSIANAKGNTKEIWTSIKKMTSNSITQAETKELQINDTIVQDLKDIAKTC